MAFAALRGSGVVACAVFRDREWAAGNRACGYCAETMVWMGGDLHPTADHRVPRCDGGGNEDANLLLACNGCNQRKGVMPEAAFRAMLAAERRCEVVDG